MVNYKTLMKIIGESTNKGDILWLYIRKISIMKMSIPHKNIYRCSAILIKLPMLFFTEKERIILKFLWNYKRLCITKITLSKKYH